MYPLGTKPPFIYPPLTWTRIGPGLLSPLFPFGDRNEEAKSDVSHLRQQLPAR